MEITNPYKDEVLYSRVFLKPNQMNNDLYINLKNKETDAEFEKLLE